MEREGYAMSCLAPSWIYFHATANLFRCSPTQYERVTFVHLCETLTLIIINLSQTATSLCRVSFALCIRILFI